MTIAALMQSLLEGAADNTALTSAEAGSNRRLQGRDLGGEMRGAATALIDTFSLSKGDRIILRAGNSVDHAVVALGAMAAGLVVLPVHPAVDADDLAEFFEEYSPTAYVYDSDAPPTPLDGLDGVDLRSLLTTDQGREHARVPWTVADDDLAVIISTSGSSGRPKGVCLTHGALSANAEALTAHLLLGVDDVHLGILPLYHSNALHFSLITALLNGSTSVIARGFPVRGIAAWVLRHGVTHISAAPQALQLMLRDPAFRAERLPTLRLVVTASAPLSQSLCQEFVTTTGIPLLQGYGLTECTNFATMTPTGLSEDQYRTAMFSREVASVGTALPGTRITIAQPTERDTSGNDIGEVVLSGPQLSPGYWGGHQFHDVLRTGDLGYLHEIGGQDFLFLTGRSKEIIIRNGENFSPRQIDDDLAGSLRSVDYAVLGLPDDTVGEEIALCVHGEPTRNDLVMAALAGVPQGRRPRLILWLTEPIPRTATGKVMRARLRDACGPNSSARSSGLVRVTDLRRGRDDVS